MKLKNAQMFLAEDDGSGMAPSPIGNPWEGHQAIDAPTAPIEPPKQPSPTPEPGQPPGPMPPEHPPGRTRIAEPGTKTRDPQGEPPSVEPGQTSGDSAWTPERVAELLRASRETPAAQTPPPPQMSEEEVNRMLNVIQVGQEDVQAILEGGEPAVAALNKVIQGAVMQARTTAWYQTQVLLRQQQERLAPVMDYYHQQQQEKLTSQFFTENKDFKPEVHTKLLAAVKTSLDAEDAFRGKSRAEGFKLIAERAKEILTASGTPLVPVTTPNGGKMAQLSRSTGHGAAAAAGSGGAPQSSAQRFFG